MVVNLIGDFFGSVLFGSIFFLYPALGAYALGGPLEVVAVLEPSPGLLAGMAGGSVVGLGALWIFLHAWWTRTSWNKAV